MVFRIVNTNYFSQRSEEYNNFCTRTRIRIFTFYLKHRVWKRASIVHTYTWRAVRGVNWIAWMDSRKQVGNSLFAYVWKTEILKTNRIGRKHLRINLGFNWIHSLHVCTLRSWCVWLVSTVIEWFCDRCGGSGTGVWPVPAGLGAQNRFSNIKKSGQILSFERQVKFSFRPPALPARRMGDAEQERKFNPPNFMYLEYHHW